MCVEFLARNKQGGKRHLKMGSLRLRHLIKFVFESHAQHCFREDSLAMKQMIEGQNALMTLLTIVVPYLKFFAIKEIFEALLK